MIGPKNIAVFLFDYTGVAALPWLNSGYECWIVDAQHAPAYETGGVTDLGNLKKVHWDLGRPWLPPFDLNRIAFVAAWPPCDHLAVSGARWFRGKGLRKLSESVALFATAVEFCEWSQAPYMIENPVSSISSYWRKPDYTFSPEQYTGYCEEDNYTKKTCLWIGGGFVMPRKLLRAGLPQADDRIHKCAPGAERKNTRSASPRGFCEAVFLSNSHAPIVAA